MTPSGNIHCFYVPAKPAHLLCDIRSAAYTKRAQSDCMARAGLDWHGFEVYATRSAMAVCSGGILYNSNRNAPHYAGSRTEGRGISARSLHIPADRAHVYDADGARHLSVARFLARLVASRAQIEQETGDRLRVLELCNPCTDLLRGASARRAPSSPSSGSGSPISSSSAAKTTMRSSANPGDV